LEHYQERGTTVNSSRYSEMLRDKLKPAAWTKRRGLLSKGVALLHDNACLHTVPPTLLKPSTIWTLRYWSILRKVLTWPVWTTACLVHSKTL
jgi:hypothetical protein